MARRVRTAVTLLVLLGIVAAGAYYGWAGLTRGWVGDGQTATAEEEPAEACSTPPAITVRAQGVRVSVYNAGAPGGQATEVFEALARQGFVEGELGDTPDRVEVKGIVVVPGNAEDGFVSLVEQQFRKVRVAERRKTRGPGVNVLVGREFGRLARKAPRSIEIAQKPVCGQAS